MSVTLLNGTSEPRVRSSDGCTVHECGCAHTDVLWLQMCAEHYEPWRTAHERAALEHNYEVGR